jgi:hypothetical protein
MTTVLLDGWQALLGFTFAIIAAGTLIGIHAIENNAARIEMRKKLETKSPDRADPNATAAGLKTSWIPGRRRKPDTGV